MDPRLILLLLHHGRTGELATIRQSTVYQAPKVGGSEMSDADVVATFHLLIYSRQRMIDHFADYVAAGWTKPALQYFDMPKAAGSSGMSSVAAQTTLSTPAQRAVTVYTNTITMDTGEFTDIHDAIINETAVDGLYPTEGWFLHKTDGTRYETVGGGASGASQYRMNFANADWRTYYINKLEREFEATDPAHLPMGATGLFFDNINESWNDLSGENGGNPPVEFADRAAYQAGLIGFLAAVRSAYPSLEIWGNMTTLESGSAIWNAFKPYLDGAMVEGAFLDWDGTPLSPADVVSENEIADEWAKKLLYIVQGDAAETYHEYTFGLYLLMSNLWAYFFFTDQVSYANYYDLASYASALGSPLGAREEVSSGVWRRYFRHGNVVVNMNTQVSTITIDGANEAPTASSVTITGTVLSEADGLYYPETGAVLTGNYTYGDADSDAEGTSTFRWLRDDVAISGATSQTYTPVEADVSHVLKFEVTPVAATGTSPGTAVASSGSNACKRCYYVSTSGSDSADGLSPANAWLTMAKIESTGQVAGDRVRLKRGDEWLGEDLILPSSGSAGNRIVFGRYGTSGANPRLNLLVTKSDYTLYSGSIYSRSPGFTVNQVLDADERMIKSVDYASMVAGSFFQTGGVLYVWCADNGDPNNRVTHPNVNGHAFRINAKSYITVDGIDVRGSCLGNFSFRDGASDNVTIKNCTADWASMRGFDMGVGSDTATNIVIDNNVADSCNGEGIWIGFCDGVTVSNNEVKNIALDISKGYPTTGYGTGLLVGNSALGVVVEGNYVHSTYYNSEILIEQYVRPVDTIIRNNRFIHDVASTAACAVDAGDGSFWYNNIIINTAGTDALAVKDDSVGCLIIHNTIIVSGATAYGIGLIQNTNTWIYNSIICRSDTNGGFIRVLAAGVTGFYADYNDYWQSSGTYKWFWSGSSKTTLALWRTACSGDANAVVGDPAFTTAYTDLHIGSGSAAIELGDYDDLIPTDFDGVTRGDPPDAGAYEYVP